MERFTKLAILGLFLLVCLAALVNSAELTVTQNVTVTVLSPMKVYSPQNDLVYASRVVKINVSTEGVVSDIRYRDNGGFPEVRLCTNCKNVYKEKSFDDGFHSVFFSAGFPDGRIFQNVSFWVDSRAPVMKKISPTSGFADGNFEVSFYEVNPRQVTLKYGNDVVGFRAAVVDLSTCEVKRDTWTCRVRVELGDFNEKSIRYWFEVRDVASHLSYSKVGNVAVDFSAPVINNLGYSVDGKKVDFMIDINEPNFKVISYKDLSESRPTEVVLCRKLVSGICSAEKRFRPGNHNLLFKVEDTAGNFANATLQFNI